MSKMITCDKCKNEFILDESRFGVIQQDDLLVQYFSCPVCGKKYHVFTSDSEMRALAEKSKLVQLKIQAAFLKKFRKKTIQEYEHELDQIKQKQQSIWPRLKSLGEKIIQGAAES